MLGNSTILHLVDSARPRESLNLIWAIVWVISQFADHTVAPINIKQYAAVKANYDYHNDIIGFVLHSYSLNKERGSNTRFLLQGVQVHDPLQDVNSYDALTIPNAIWLVDSLRAYNRLESDLLNPQLGYKRNGFYYIIYTGQQQNRHRHMAVIFQRLFEIFVTNVNMLIVVDEVPVVYTYFPYAPSRCSSAKPVFLFSFRNISARFTEFESEAPDFANKFRNMHGCNVSVTLWHQPPYVYLEQGKTPKVHGIEGSLLTIMAKKMNFTVQLIKEPNRDRGYAYANGTMTGATKLIYELQSNLTLGAYAFDIQRAAVLQASIPYISTPVLLAIPKGKTLSAFDRIRKPFKHIIWSCVCASIFIGIMAIGIVRLLRNSTLSAFVFGHGNRIPFTNLLNVLFGGPVNNRLPMRNFARYLLGVWLLYTFVLRVSYSGAMFLLLQDGRSRLTIRTLAEAVDVFPVFYTHAAMVLALRDSIPRRKIRLIDTHQNSLEKLIQRMTREHEKLAVTITEARLKAAIKPDSNRYRDVATLPQTVITSAFVMYMPKHSYLLGPINNMILRVFACGLLERLERFYLDKHKANPDKEPEKLTMELLSGIFITYAIGLLICCIVFVLELLAQRWPMIRDWLEFCNC